MTQKRETEMDRDLDLMFQAARDHVQPPSDRLMQAILLDAAEARAARDAPVRPAAPSWFRRTLDGIGGWQSVTALAVSTCLGLWIGYAAPNLTDLLDGGLSLAGDTAVEYTLYSDIDDLLMEG
jgi:hypothetical protein